MADKPVSEVVAVDAVLDALSSPTSSDVYEALDAYSTDAVAAVAAKRAAGGGGGGSQTVKVERAPIVFDDPDILTGIAVYTPAAGEVLLAGSFVSITTPWNGGFSLLSIFSTGDTPTAFDIAQGDPSNADGSWTTKTASPAIPFSASLPSGAVVFTDATPVPRSGHGRRRWRPRINAGRRRDRAPDRGGVNSPQIETR